ncbi:VOC family protein [Sphingomonas profundi]|uniref:VOC family protein n=1 Tax=Alterirhizorhabdus profundi TaxID=2681549 RepID=UPI0012E94000|nr:VOC family protein [Sphingomonas profundi]
MIPKFAHDALAGLGTVVQVAFIPRDFDASFRYWTEVMGAGPFYHLEHIPLQNTRYMGQPAECDLSAALGYWGDIQIELIVQHDTAPSIYRDWLASGRNSVHHIGVLVDDFDRAYAALAAAGGVAVQETEIVDATRAAYFQMPDPDAPIVELLWLREHFLTMWARMRESSTTWDGKTDPLRAPPA